MNPRTMSTALRTVTLIQVLAVLAVLAACSPFAAPEWSRDFDSVAQQFELIRQAQAEDNVALPPEAREAYQGMQAAFNHTSQMHSMMMQSMSGHGMMGGRRMGNHMLDATTMMQFRETNQQLLSYSQGMQQMMGRAGHRDVADMYGQMADRMQGLLSRLPPNAGSRSLTPEAPQSAADGATVFAVNCASCHGARGEGLAGAFPPLSGSPIVSGEPDIPIAIVLHGLQGPVTVAGQSYDGTMPAFGATLSDAEIAAALSFVRALPGNAAGSVTPADVNRRRNATASRVAGFTAGELGID